MGKLEVHIHAAVEYKKNSKSLSHVTWRPIRLIPLVILQFVRVHV